MRFDEASLVPSAGLLPAAALAQRVNLVGLIDQRVRLASEAANSGTKALTVIESILAGGDSIDDTDLLNRPGLHGGSDLTGEWISASTEEVPRRDA